MEKKIRTELYKMTAIMVVLLGLGVYAHDFVIAGIQAKVALNSSIFILFGLAAWLGFRHVIDLKNEVTALNALKADYDPANRGRTRLVDMDKPAVVYHQPELLGDGYRLINEELGKGGELVISNGTVQTIMHDVDLRINDRKSTLIYFSGLMVFLGLLGAFMGLMKTVHSVSDLIGAMDMSGKGGADSISKMIEGMKAPLNGMSVGFSSSLFGLMTSMVLGALERCMTSAMKVLRNEFEHWIGKMAALESAGGESANSLADDRVLRRVLEAGTQHLRDLGQLAEANTRLNEAGQHRAEALHATLAQMGGTMEAMTQAVAALADPRETLAPIAGAVEQLATHQADMLTDIRNLHAEAAADRENMRALVKVLEVTVERLEAVDGPELHVQLDRILHAAQQRGHVEPETSMVIQREPAGRGIGGWLMQWYYGRRVFANLRETQREIEALSREMRVALGGNRREMRKAGRLLGRRLERMEQGRDRDRHQIERFTYLAQAQQADLAEMRRRMAGHSEQGTPPGTYTDTPYKGGRALMQNLRERLHVDFETPPPASETPEQRASANRRATGQ